MFDENCFSRRREWLILILVVTAVGCGKHRNWAPVSGRVTLDGKPQEAIYVYFQPTVPPGGDAMNVGSSSYGRTDAEGRFTLNFMDPDKDRSGALIATHMVRMDDEWTFGPDYEPPEAKGRGPLRSRIPRGWQSTFVVPEEGTTEANFELSE